MTFLVPTGQSADALSIPELKNLPLSQLVAMNAGLSNFKKAIRQHEDALQAEYERRFAAAAAQLRRQQNKDTGTVRLAAEGYVVIADLPKKTEYDQDRLRAAVATLLAWGEDPDHYVITEIKVPEAKYNAWPPTIRNLFEPARTVRTGKATYKLELAGSANDAQMHEVA